MLKRNRISSEQAITAYKIFTAIDVKQVSIDIASSVRIAHTFGIYAYDAYFLECALEYDFPLLTLDKKLARIAKSLSIYTFSV